MWYYMFYSLATKYNFSDVILILNMKHREIKQRKGGGGGAVGMGGWGGGGRDTGRSDQPTARAVFTSQVQV